MRLILAVLFTLTLTLASVELTLTANAEGVRTSDNNRWLAYVLNFTPAANNTVDLCSSALKCKDLYLAGNANITGNVTGTWAGSTVSISVGGTGLTAVGTADQIPSTNDAGAGLNYRTLTTGTAGTDFALTQVDGAITFNLPTASAFNRGALSTTDWTTFNNKQVAGSYITALTGDVTASGPGSVAATIANNAVTLAKMNDIVTASILGRDTAATGDPEVLSVATVRSMLSLNLVENTALSTWAGTTNITTLGTIATGTWNATTIDIAKGGSGQTTAITASSAIANFGQLQTHPSFTDFNAVQQFGHTFVQGDTNGVGDGQQHYQMMLSLGSEYVWGSGQVYAMQMAFARNVSQPYIWVRYKEGGANTINWGAWSKARAGIADSATSATTADTVTTAAQPNITSLGTLTSLATGAITSTGILTINNTGVSIITGGLRIGPDTFSMAAGSLSIGNVSVDYTPTSVNWASTGSTLLLNGLNYTAIGFHDSGNRIDYIRVGAGTMTLGYNADYGAAAIAIPGTLGVTGITSSGNVVNTVATDGRIRFGPNTTWSEYLTVGGNGHATSDASIVATNGNVHIDPKVGAYGSYLNYYAGTAGVFFGNGASGTNANITAGGVLTATGLTLNGQSVFTGGNITAIIKDTYAIPADTVALRVTDLNNVVALDVWANGRIVSARTYAQAVGGVNRAMLVDSDGIYGNATSSRRYKKNIVTLESVEWLYKLRPVVFDYIDTKQGFGVLGLVAEEVAEINIGMTTPDKQGRPETVEYHRLITPMLVELQRHHARLTALGKTNLPQGLTIIQNLTSQLGTPCTNTFEKGILVVTTCN